MVENKVTGRKYRILVDSINNIWDRISFWTKASDVEFNDGTVLEGKSFGHAMLERSKTYNVGEVAYCTSAPSWCMFRCTTSGTTAASEPTTYQTISTPGTAITDGTAKFTVYDIRPVTTMSNNAYTVPSVGLVNTHINTLNNSITANGKTFYFDYRNGKYGYNTSSSRGADTFHPFSDTEYTVDVALCSVTGWTDGGGAGCTGNANNMGVTATVKINGSNITITGYGPVNTAYGYTPAVTITGTIR